MSASGYKLPPRGPAAASALRPKAVATVAGRRVRFGPLPDSCTAVKSVNFKGAFCHWETRPKQLGSLEGPGGANVKVRFAMAYDSDEGAFHLTPAGWLRVDEEPFPADRIETWRYSMYQALGWSREHKSLYCEWVDPAIAREERDLLRKKYGWPDGLAPSRDIIIGSAP